MYLQFGLITVPSRVHIFLWLMSHNKLMTKDNLLKRNIVKPLDCAFCPENESINHLFFDCIVAKCLWAELADMFKIDIGANFESFAKYWISSKKHAVQNSVIAAVVWCL